ncbi:hypothetical protein VTJ83DRAFT_1847 [Remersonia thermophila]|uniref:Peptidase A1 domain-containing protein n=1 Tax=Remersonia thermophila TaxID=72144 RepID=A0ABR4DH36_9PEZI
MNYARRHKMNPHGSRILTIAVLLLALAPLAAVQSTACPPQPLRLVLGNCSNVPAAWGAELGIGEGRDAPKLCFMPSTVVNATLLMARDLCDGEDQAEGADHNYTLSREQCLSRRGGALRRDSLSRFAIELDAGARDNLRGSNPGWWKLMSEQGLEPFPSAVRVPLRFGHVVTSAFDQVWVMQGKLHSMNHLGLAADSNLLGSLAESKLISPGSGWGLDVGSRSVTQPRDGSLVLGGYDSNAFQGNLVPFPIPKSGGGPVANRICHLQVSMKKLAVNISVNGTQQEPLLYEDPTTTTGVCIEPYDDFFRLGKKKTQEIVNRAGIRLIHRPEKHPDLFNPEEGLVYDKSLNLSITLDITLDKGFTVTIPSSELVRPLTALNRADGKLVTHPDYNEIAIFRSDPLDDSAVFGRAFLSQQVYLVVDPANREFLFGRLKQRPDVAPVLTTTVACPAPPKLSKAEIGLVAVGIVLGVQTLALLWLGIRKIRRKRGASRTAEGGGGDGVTPNGRILTPPDPPPAPYNLTNAE